MRGMGNILTLPVTVRFEEFECWVCGVPFALSAQFASAMRRDGTGFKCPRGCGLRFGEGELVVARRQLADAQRELDAERQRAYTNHVAREKAERELKRVKKRVSGGACPCCQRSFTNLGRHMATKHPEFGVAK